MSEETALAISFLNGNLTSVARRARRDGTLAVGIALELIRLGHPLDVEVLRSSLEAIQKESGRVSKLPLR